MKKTLSILLLIALVFALALVPGLIACNDAEDDVADQDDEDQNNAGSQGENITKEYSIGVIADSQVLPAAAFVDCAPMDGSFGKEWKAYPIEHALEYSEAFFNSAVDSYIDSGIKFMLLIGDITNDADPRAVEIVKQGLDKLKAAGIDVYTTLGLCDRYGTPKDYYQNYCTNLERWDADENFKSDFYQYMGAEPYLEDTNTLSYAVNVPNSDITIISLDATANLQMAETYNVHYIMQNLDKYNYSQTSANTDKLIDWLKEALLEAQVQNRTPIITSYMPTDYNVTKLYGSSTKANMLVLNKYEQIQALCAEYGVKAVFNGQLHTPGDSTYTSESGVTFQRISTGSLCTYPLPITTYDVMSNKTFVRHIGRVASVDEEYIPTYASKEDSNLLLTDAVALAKQATITGFIWVNKDKIGSNGSSADGELGYIIKALSVIGIYDSKSKACADLMEAANDWLFEVNDIPIYGENSVESLCASYGISIPQMDCETIVDFMGEMVCTMYDGTFDLSPDGDNYKMLKYCFYTGANHIIECDLLGLAHDMKDGIIDCDLQPAIDYLFEEDIIDLKINDIIRSFVSIIVIRINEASIIKMEVTDTQSLLSGLSQLLPIGLALLPEEDYDASTQSIWGVPYLEIADLAKGEIYPNAFFQAIGPQFFTASCVKYK